MSKPAGSAKRTGLLLLLVPLCLYFAVVALQPGWLHLAPLGLPLSIWLAVGMIWHCFLVTLIYLGLTGRKDTRA